MRTTILCLETTDYFFPRRLVRVAPPRRAVSEIFTPRVALEMVVRGTAVYWFLYVMFRLVIRRRVGAVGMADILIVVIVADAIQNAMSGTYETVGDGFVLVATLIAWTVFTDWLSYVSPALQKILEPPPLPLVRHGKLLRRNMRAEFVSEAELQQKLREHGITDYAEVEAANLESDGAVSVIRRRPPPASPG